MKRTKKLLTIILSIGMIIFAPNALAEEIIPASIKDIDIYYGYSGENKPFTEIELTINDDIIVGDTLFDVYDADYQNQNLSMLSLFNFRIVNVEDPGTKNGEAYDIEKAKADYAAGQDASSASVLKKGTKLYYFGEIEHFTSEEIKFSVNWRNSENQYYKEEISYLVIDGGIKGVASATKKDITVSREAAIELLENYKNRYPNIEIIMGDAITSMTFGIKTNDENYIELGTIEFDEKTLDDLYNEMDILSKKVLSALKAENQTTTYEKKNADDKLLYSWTFDGKQMTAEDTKLNVNFEIAIIETPNKEKIDALIPSSIASLKIDFKHSGSLPTGTTVKLNVADSFDNEDILDLYYYNAETNTLEKVAENIIVTDGYVTFPLAHCSEYVLVSTGASTNSQDNNVQTSSINIILYAIISVVSLSALGYIIKSKNKEIA